MTLNFAGLYCQWAKCDKTAMVRLCRQNGFAALWYTVNTGTNLSIIFLTSLTISHQAFPCAMDLSSLHTT